MNNKSLITASILFICILIGCVSAQQIRDGRIRDNQEMFNTFSPDIQDKVRLGQIDLGFTQDMVYLAWGGPDRIYMRTTKDGDATVWSYTIVQTRFRTERMSIPVHYYDRVGRRRTEYHNVWVNRDTGEEYAAARIEFIDGVVTAIEQLIP
jgi:hypothetical protein